MAYFVYILECGDGNFYTGITWDISKRLVEYSNGLSLATKGRLPVRLVHEEIYPDKYMAAKREKEIKGWRREKKLKLMAVYTEE